MLCLKEALKKSNKQITDILGIGITNQRETTCAFNKKGVPWLAKAIVWQDKRTIYFCNKHSNMNEKIRHITGLPLDPYFSAT